MEFGSGPVESIYLYEPGIVGHRKRPYGQPSVVAGDPPTGSSNLLFAAGWQRAVTCHSGPDAASFRVPGSPNGSNKDCPVTTYSPKASEIERAWVLIDAEGLVLGRLATEVANILRGKHKPTYAPHIDTGDHVVIINADKVVLTSDKAEKKKLFRHSGFPGGIKEQTYADLLDRKPAEAVRGTIRGMVPKTRLGAAQLRKLKVYAGPTHPHAAQQPQTLELAHARRSA